MGYSNKATVGPDEKDPNVIREITQKYSRGSAKPAVDWILPPLPAPLELGSGDVADRLSQGAAAASRAWDPVDAENDPDYNAKPELKDVA